METINYDLIDETPRPRIKRFEPKCRYDFCKVMSAINGQPIGAILSRTKHWPDDWFIQVQSLCKEKDKVSQAKIVNMWLRDTKLKEI